MWRSFHYDENVEMIDAYVNRIKQVAVLLNYGEPQILELFKNTLPSRLYWILFPTEDLRVAIDATKGVLMKKDRQLSGQFSTTTPFMKVGDVHNYNRKTVSFNTQDLVQEQLDNLTSMVYNVSIQKEGYNRTLSPRYIKREGEARTDKMLETETEIDHPVGIEQTTDKTMTKTLGKTIGDNHRIDETIGEGIIDAKIMEPEMRVEIITEIE